MCSFFLMVAEKDDPPPAHLDLYVTCSQRRTRFRRRRSTSCQHGTGIDAKERGQHKQAATLALTKPLLSEGLTGDVCSSYVGSAPNFSRYCSLLQPGCSPLPGTSVMGGAAAT